jgi:polyhydroxyalkanoate synthesis regulator phasin
MTEENVQQDALFMGLITMLSQGVMQHLGKIADPLSGKVEKNIEAAKATIDLILMLKNKTKGNLGPEEERFMSNVLTNLQLNYVEEIDSSKKESPN